MFQDIEPHKFDNTYRAKEPTPDSKVLLYKGTSPVLRSDGNFFTYHQLVQRKPVLPVRFFFSIDGTDYFYHDTDDFSLDPEAVVVSDLRNRNDLPKDTVFAAAVGMSLARWYRTRRFCGCCGGRMEHSEKERAMKCSACGITEYPKISPVVIVGITDGDRIVFSKYKVGYAHWALIAGFSEIGESIEGTVRREAFEETGLKVKNIRYFGGQPWPYSDSMLMGFFCDLDGDDTIHIQEDELAVAEWVNRSDIEEQKNLFSLTATMMEAFRTGKDR